MIIIVCLLIFYILLTHSSYWGLKMIGTLETIQAPQREKLEK